MSTLAHTDYSTYNSPVTGRGKYIHTYTHVRPGTIFTTLALTGLKYRPIIADLHLQPRLSVVVVACNRTFDIGGYVKYDDDDDGCDLNRCNMPKLRFQDHSNLSSFKLFPFVTNNNTGVLVTNGNQPQVHYFFYKTANLPFSLLRISLYFDKTMVRTFKNITKTRHGCNILVTTLKINSISF